MEKSRDDRNKRFLAVGLVVIWFILAILQGIGVVGTSIKPYIGPFPFSVFYLLCMGVWGVIITVIVVSVFSPGFYKKVSEIQNDKNDR